MDGITVILTAYRRPHVLLPQVEAIRAQTLARPGVALGQRAGAADAGGIDRCQPGSRRQLQRQRLVHARFALALTASTE